MTIQVIHKSFIIGLVEGNVRFDNMCDIDGFDATLKIKSRFSERQLTNRALENIKITCVTFRIKSAFFLFLNYPHRLCIK